MTEAAFDAKRLRQLLAVFVDEVEGEWVLVGGALTAVWLDRRRVTEDIDLVGREGKSQERYRLMEFADEHDLPVEAVNSAADYFLRRISGWEDELVELTKGERSRIWRPTPTLYLLLKIGRLSERDFQDCKRLLDIGARRQWEIDVDRVRDNLDNLRAAESDGQASRRSRLRELCREYEQAATSFTERDSP